MTTQVQLVRLNARIHNQREQIKHGKYVLSEVEGRANRLLDMLGIDQSQPLVMRLDEAIAAQSDSRRMVETTKIGSMRSTTGGVGATAPMRPTPVHQPKGEEG